MKLSRDTTAWARMQGVRQHALTDPYLFHGDFILSSGRQLTADRMFGGSAIAIFAPSIACSKDR